MDIRINTDVDSVSAVNFDSAPILEPTYTEIHPYVGEDGIYMPVVSYIRDGYEAPIYRLVMTKDMFVEAYNKWIKEEVT